ncbi:putative prolyl 4-hydroxylase 10-like protein 2 [Colletotrichum chlorophyti]|uniref:Putative prolyl 4-hydroxylase 10-like protein 2 n=1 Tax=Colletotrichum chlorophyti TaxID=708187 RepID=A0A1Q8S993_9PEZI|nr:putative prolyl 4-hydroxylase 10-like protein 2 [Colletotrichum chlorophyti]
MTHKELFHTSMIVALLAAAFSTVFRSTSMSSFGVVNSCARPRYTVRTLSYDPLIQHIENFVTPQEAQHLLQIAQPKFQRSRAIGTDGRSVAAQERTSSTAFLSSDDPIVQCIRSRASEFQGYVDLGMMEDLQVTRYLEGQQYTNHYDWAANPAARNQTTNRETTFFAVLDVECSNCGTRFPKVSVDWSAEDQRWCGFVDYVSSKGIPKASGPDEYEITAGAFSDRALFNQTLDSWQSLSHGFVRATPYDGSGPQKLFAGGLFEIAAFHQVHCLTSILEDFGLLAAGVPKDQLPGYNAGVTLTWEEHKAHCFNYVRQALMCFADSTAEGHIEGDPHRVADHGVMHVCNDFDALLAWSRQPERALPKSWRITD